MTRLAILETGRVPAHLAPVHGPYDAMMRHMLGDGFDYRTYAVAEGDWPEQVETHDVYLVTGSPAGVYDPLPWIGPLERFLQAAHGRARLIGICFGHQVMAQALGGRVEKSHKGWGLGLHRYELVAARPWMDEGPAEVAIAASHQDQVVAPPERATVLARSEFTPFAMLDYGEGAISMQFHPEFARDYAEALVELRRPSFAAADAALASLAQPSDAGRVAGWLRRFAGGGWRAPQPRG